MSQNDELQDLIQHFNREVFPVALAKPSAPLDFKVYMLVNAILTLARNSGLRFVDGVSVQRGHLEKEFLPNCKFTEVDGQRRAVFSFAIADDPSTVQSPD